MANPYASAVSYAAGAVVQTFMLPMVIVLVLGAAGVGLLLLRRPQSKGRK